MSKTSLKAAGAANTSSCRVTKITHPLGVGVGDDRLKMTGEDRSFSEDEDEDGGERFSEYS
jgi:hypothetical protein